MTHVRVVDLHRLEPNSSSINLLARSKKLPPPPLNLPVPNTTTDEEKSSNEQKKSTTNCCLSSSSEECPHKPVPYVLPVARRPQILDTLIRSSSTLLVPSPSESKHKKSHPSANSNLLQQHHASTQGTVPDAEWLDFIRLIVHKPLENELTMLLDKYKTTFFDRVNAPHTTDATIRASLCTIVSEALTTYSANSSSPTTSSVTGGASSSNLIPSPNVAIIPANNSSSKRKRKNTSTSISESATMNINSQTKFVISHIIPGKDDNSTNSNKMTNQQRQKQFQKKYSHLFRYIPDKNEQASLTREGYLKNMSISSSRSCNNNICLMLYDEVLVYMDQHDLELSGISINDSFTLFEPILAHIQSSIQ